jgi:intracellular septation protein A
MRLFTYRRPFTVDGRACEARVVAGMEGLASTLLIDGAERARDSTPTAGPEAVRNHRLIAELDDGSTLDVEAGYRNLWDVAIAVRRDGTLIHESHPGARIAYPKAMTKMTVGMPAAPPGHWQRNRLPLTVDVASGVFFYVVAKAFDLTTAALAGAALAIVLVALERALKKDLTGGLVLFGVLMSLVAAGLAFAFQTDEAVKWRTSVVGGIGATIFLTDGLLNRGRWLGKALGRYMPFALDPRRTAIGLGLTGAAMALLNLVAMRALSTDGWLLYHSFLDNFVAMGLVIAAVWWARDRRAAGSSDATST